MADYRYLVADLLTNTIRAEIPFTGVGFSRVLDRAGSFKATIPYQHPKATRTNLDPGRTAIYVERDGVIVWGGILWTARRAAGSPNVDIGGMGFWSYFHGRAIRRSHGFLADQLTVARTLVADAQNTSYYPGGDIGIVLDTTLSGAFIVQRYDAFEFKDTGAEVEQLSSAQGGFDFSIDSAWEAGALVNRMHWWYPRKGARSGVVLELGTNVSDIGWAIDGTALANHVDALGSGSGAGMLVGSADNTTALLSYPRLEAAVPFKDETSHTKLIAHARAELAARGSADAVADLVVTLTGDVAVGTFTEGDDVHVRANDGFVSVDNWYRILSYTVTVDTSGTESMAVVLTGSEAFA